jgi:SCP-2 sterol transfer family
MPPYLSPEWVQAFNAALANLDLRDAIAAAGAGSLTASLGTFNVAQVVTDAPDTVSSTGATVRTVLTVEDGHIAFTSDPDGTMPSNVTIVLTYADAMAMARGQVDPADALASGSVRVRGELAVLVAGQAVLNAASAALGQTLTDLTDVDATDMDSGADDGTGVNSGADAGG